MKLKKIFSCYYKKYIVKYRRKNKKEMKNVYNRRI